MVKIMIPIKENKGRDSIPSDTLGGAPQYYIVDTEGDVSREQFSLIFGILYYRII